MSETFWPVMFFVGLFLLCLPFAFLRWLVLAVYGWGLRLGLVALIASASFFFFRPQGIPSPVKAVVSEVGALLGIDDLSWSVAACAGLLTAALLPLISLLDAARMPVVATERQEAPPEPAGPSSGDKTTKTHAGDSQIRPSHKTQAAISSMSGERKRRLSELVE